MSYYRMQPSPHRLMRSRHVQRLAHEALQVANYRMGGHEDIISNCHFLLTWQFLIDGLAILESSKVTAINDRPKGSSCQQCQVTLFAPNLRSHGIF